MLIPVHFTISQNLKIDNTSSVAIPQGSCLKISGQDADGNFLVTHAKGTDVVIGLAGDNYLFNTNEDDTNYIVGINTNDMGYAADIVVGASGQTTRSMNHINDLYKDTLGSGYMTVYSGVGVFRTTRFVATATFTPGAAVYLATAAANGTSGGQNLGKIDTTTTSNTKVGTCLLANQALGAGGQAFASGVPGTDINGSISLGNFVTFQMAIG